MKRILCFGDSNTWGYYEGSRLGGGVRWTSLLQQAQYTVIEEGMNGRTTVFDDQPSPGRRGLDYLAPCLASHDPLDLVVIMLGTNDTKVMFNAPVAEIANGMGQLVKVAQTPFVYPGRVVPQLLVVSPIHVGDDIAGSMFYGSFDQSSVEKSRQLAAAYRALAEMYGCHFMDAAQFAAPAKGEAIHMDPAGHRGLAQGMAEKLREILG